MKDDDRPTDADIARQAAIHSLVSNLVYLAVMVGFTVALAKRDTLGRLVMRARRWARPGEPEHLGQAMAELHRDIARFEGRQP